jgi:hypothetical protein
MVSSYSVLFLSQTISHFTLDSYVQVYIFVIKSNQLFVYISISLTGVRLQSQSEQMLIYYRYEIVMEYTKRARLPPPFVFISHIGNEKLFLFLFILIFVNSKTCSFPILVVNV